VGAPAGSAIADPPERDHTVTTSPAEGRFRCGELLLTTTAGTQTEIIDSRFKNGVANVRIQGDYDGVTMAGSDGLVYRATAHVNAHFVLIAPDFDNPVRGDEIIHVSFVGGPQGSPGYLNEHLRIRGGWRPTRSPGPATTRTREALAITRSARGRSQPHPGRSRPTRSDR
jgi:hypothetical protein